MHMKKAINPKDWSPVELAELIDLYQYFLNQQLSGNKYQKAGPVRALMARLSRTRGSIEAKLMNISGVLAALGMGACIVRGYKPLSNYSVDMVEPVKLAFAKYIDKAA